jgi:hypothetical protein
MRMCSRASVDEPVETRTAQPWAFDWSLAPPYTEEVHGELRRRIAAALSATAP